MDLFKKKRGKGKKKEKTPSKTKLDINQKKKKQKKDKKNKKQTSSNKSGSDSENSDSESRKKLEADNAAALERLNKNFQMAGSLIKVPAVPPGYHRELMIAEYREMFSPANSLSNDECKVLDLYMRQKAELRPSDHVVISEKVTNDEKTSVRLKIGTKFAEGRFGAIYIIQQESGVDDNFSATCGYLMMKTSLRIVSSAQVSARLTREIKALNILAYPKEEEKFRRIPQILFEGRVLGVPFFVTKFLDQNLEKCREQMGSLISIPSTFFIAQEILMALKYVHKKGFVHRDVKPTNVVLHPTNRNQWYLIDFGDTIAHGKTLRLCPPDGLTLPFLSREAHVVLNAPGPSGYIQDIESWFYTFIDMIKNLSWKDNNNIEEVYKSKKLFWDDIEAALPAADYTSFPLQIAKIIKNSKTLESPYADISKILQDGFAAAKAAEPDWKPDWIDRQMTAQMNKVRKNAYARVISDQEVKQPQRERSIYMFVNDSKRNVRTPTRDKTEEFKPATMDSKFEPYNDRSNYCAVGMVPVEKHHNNNKYRYKDRK